MRKASTLVGLTLFALAAPARAREIAPAAATPVPPTGGAAATPAPPAATAAAPPAAPALASEAGPAAPSKKRFEVGLSFLPMAMGRYTSSPSTVETVTTDAYFAYGVGLSVGYEILPYLVVGLAPQAIFSVGEKAPAVPVEGTTAAREYDLMGRVAGVLTIVEGTTAYAEVLPGYSIITTDAGPTGFVVAFGIGFAMNMTDRFFVNVGGGYQLGFQKWSEGANSYTTSTRYVRVALGGGVRF